MSSTAPIIAPAAAALAAGAPATVVADVDERDTLDGFIELGPDKENEGEDGEWAGEDDDDDDDSEDEGEEEEDVYGRVESEDEDAGKLSRDIDVSNIIAGGRASRSNRGKPPERFVDELFRSAEVQKLLLEDIDESEYRAALYDEDFSDCEEDSDDDDDAKYAGDDSVDDEEEEGEEEEEEALAKPPPPKRPRMAGTQEAEAAAAAVHANPERKKGATQSSTGDAPKAAARPKPAAPGAAGVPTA